LPKIKEAIKSWYFWLIGKKMFQIGQADPDRQLTGKPLVPTRPFQWWHIDFSLPKEAINKFLRLITK
jgi:hypothetical protein